MVARCVRDIWVKTWRMRMSVTQLYKKHILGRKNPQQPQRSWEGVSVKNKSNWEQEILNSSFNKVSFFKITSKSECKECRAGILLHKGLKAPCFHQLMVSPSLGWGNLHMVQTGSSSRVQDKRKRSKRLKACNSCLLRMVLEECHMTYLLISHELELPYGYRKTE